MPDSASQERTLEVLKKVERVFAGTDGVAHTGGFQGFSLIAGNGSNYGVVFAGLKPWTYRVPRGRDLQTMLAEVRHKFEEVQEGTIIAFYRPAVDGIGNASGFDLRLEDRAGVGRERMQQFAQELAADGNAQSKLRRVSTPYKAA